MKIKTQDIKIVTVKQAKDFINEIVSLLGGAFHPDTLFDDYISADNLPTFTMAEATNLDERMKEVFALFGDETLMYNVLLPEKRVDGILSIIQIQSSIITNIVLNLLEDKASFKDTDADIGEFMVCADRLNEIEAELTEKRNRSKIPSSQKSIQRLIDEVTALYERIKDHDYLQITTI